MDKKDKQEKPVTVNITNHNKFEKGVGAFITNLNHLTLVMDAEGNMKMDLGNVPVMPHTEIEEVAKPKKEEKPASCFIFPSEFTKQQVAAAVKKFYHGEHADLALIEIALYDHGQLKRRNAHTAFVKTLVAWGILKADEEEISQMLSGIKDKFRRLPKDGYKEWDNVFLNDKNRCAEIGEVLGPTMKYKR